MGEINLNEADGSEADRNEADGSEADGSEADGSEAKRNEADGIEAGGNEEAEIRTNGIKTIGGKPYMKKTDTTITENEDLTALIDKAVAGDKESLETILLSVRDLVFNLSLRMLGTFPDAEDATQDILLKIMTHLSSFKKESSFSTWVFRIAANYLIDYKKHMFAQFPLNFEFYGDDIENGKIQDVPDLTQNVEKAILAEELKLSCTNVMLQCLDMESRCIFVLGTMFRVDSRIAGEALGMTPEAYRKRLSRIRKKVADFLTDYCGEYGKGKCRCKDRINYAIQNRRLNPASLDFTGAEELTMDKMMQFKNAMEEIDDLSAQFSFCKTYESPERTRQFFREFLESAVLSEVRNPR